jgi:uncharacterized protein YndB with AHSA1/START domain
MSSTIPRIAPREFTTTRTFAAPRDLVFRAWTEPAQIAAWFGPRGFGAPLGAISNDLRPGGRWNVTMVDDATGIPYPCSFTYSQITPPERIIFMDRMAGRLDGRETVVTVTLTEVDGGTEMTFHCADPDPRPEFAGVEQGWGSSFDKLAELLDAH